MPDKVTVTEHKLYECWVSPSSNATDVRLFRAPIINDGSGDYRRLPHEITWNDLSVGDVVLAIQIGEIPSKGTNVIDVLQFWHVLERRADDEFRIRVNNLVGMAGDGEYVYDRMAGLLGLPPCSPDRE